MIDLLFRCCLDTEGEYVDPEIHGIPALYRGGESECGFDVRQIVVPAKPRVTKRSRA